MFGEHPYAEGEGDRATVEYSPGRKSDLALLRRRGAAGIPTVSVFLSGRPLWVNRELNASSAFVAAFLPGGEGGGVADLLFRGPDGTVRYDFQGRLSFSWPAHPMQTPIDRGQPGYSPLFALGDGLSYAQPGDLPLLPENRRSTLPVGTRRFFSMNGLLADCM